MQRVGFLPSGTQLIHSTRSCGARRNHRPLCSGQIPPRSLPPRNARQLPVGTGRHVAGMEFGTAARRLLACCSSLAGSSFCLPSSGFAAGRGERGEGPWLLLCNRVRESAPFPVPA